MKRKFFLNLSWTWGKNIYLIWAYRDLSTKAFNATNGRPHIIRKGVKIPE